MQTPLQFVHPAWQVQLPPWHKVPDGQALPHVPQLLLSEARLKQPPLHSLRPEVHPAAGGCLASPGGGALLQLAAITSAVNREAKERTSRVSFELR